MHLTNEELTRLLDWYVTLERRELDVVRDHDLAEKLRLELHTRYERERTR